MLQRINQQINVIHRNTVTLCHCTVDLNAHVIQPISDNASTAYHAVFRLLFGSIVAFVDTDALLGAFIFAFGLLFALWCLALNNKGVAVFFHRDKALERLVLSFVQECLDGQASILIIQPFGTHSDNEVV